MPCACSLRRDAAQRRAKRAKRTHHRRRRPKRTATGSRSSLISRLARTRVHRRRKRARQSVTAYGVSGGQLPAGMMRGLGVSSPYPGAAAPYATGSVGRLNYQPYP